VRRAATGALGLAIDARVLPALRLALQDAAWQVREEAATTLGKVGHDDAGPALITALDDDYRQVRLRATRSLDRLRYVQALPGLIETLVTASVICAMPRVSTAGLEPGRVARHSAVGSESPRVCAVGVQ
jgi:HEAT repeat protein